MGRRGGGAGPDGLAVVDKEPGWTSHDVVAKSRGLLGTRKVGHSGTLDPDATGVLLLGVGRVTRLLRFLTALPKTYTCEIVLGAETSTLDDSGEVTATHDMAGTSFASVEAAARGLTGDILQIPPMVSAVKVDGKRLHQLAREGVEVEVDSRRVVIHEAAVTDAPDADHVEITMRTGKGVYVRSLARDLALALGAEGHVSALRRERVGPFRTENAVSLDFLTDLVHRDAASEGLLPVATALDDIPELAVTDQDAFSLRQGRPIVLLPRQVETLKSRLREGSRTVSAFQGQTLVALGQLRAGRLEPDRVFNLQ